MNTRVSMHVLILAAMALNVGCASHRHGNAIEQPVDKVCVGIDNSYDCAKAMEKARIDTLSDRVSRDNHRLFIRLADGRRCVFTDDAKEVDGRLYTYLGQLERVGYDLIEVHYYEGGSYLLLNPLTGVIQQVDAVPVVSPDGARLVAASFDLEAAFNPTSISIWRINGGGLTLEFAYDFSDVDWGPGNPVWKGNADIVFAKMYAFDEQRGEGRLSFNHGRWTSADLPMAANGSLDAMASPQGQPDVYKPSQVCESLLPAF
jgi:hypothetical protein